MGKFFITLTHQRDISFNGELLAESSSQKPDGPLSMRWHVMHLYQTEGGSYICVDTRRSKHDSENDIVEARVYKTMHHVLDHFGSNLQAKRLYEKAGWDSVQYID